jgi:hypothetical protein
MKNKILYIFSIIFGIGLSIGAILVLLQSLRVYYLQYDWDIAILWLGVVIVCFFSAVMAFIKNSLYKKYLSIRICAFISSVALSLVGIMVILIAVWAITYDAGQPLSGDLGKIFVFIAFLILAAALIIFWRVRQAGWLKRANRNDITLG